MLQAAIELEGRRAVCFGRIRARAAAIDKSLVPSRGAHWHKRDRLCGRVPRGVDVDATWTYSEYHGWVEGYSYEVAVSAEKNGVVWPLSASVEQAHVRERRTVPDKLGRLPHATRYVLVDSGYDANETAESVEFEASGKRTGRRFVCPLQERHNAGRGERPRRESRARRWHRKRRDERRRWMSRPFGAE
ncbi:MAG: transposase [Planctomycetia bacterium]|nr:transposase [Planctomycetia bacterium]